MERGTIWVGGFGGETGRAKRSGREVEILCGYLADGLVAVSQP